MIRVRVMVRFRVRVRVRVGVRDGVRVRVRVRVGVRVSVYPHLDVRVAGAVGILGCQPARLDDGKSHARKALRRRQACWRTGSRVRKP